MLSARGSDSIFKIVETNDFNQLPHITLAFRPGNDVAVKQVRHDIVVGHIGSHTGVVNIATSLPLYAILALHRLNVHMWLQFLAFRLSEVKLTCEHLTADLNMTMVSPLAKIFCADSCMAAQLQIGMLNPAESHLALSATRGFLAPGRP